MSQNRAEKLLNTLTGQRPSSLPITGSQEESKETNNESVDLDISTDDLAAITYLKKQSAEDLNEAYVCALEKARQAEPGHPERACALLMQFNAVSNMALVSLPRTVRDDINAWALFYSTLMLNLDILHIDELKKLVISYLYASDEITRQYQYRGYPFTLFDNISNMTMLYARKAVERILALDVQPQEIVDMIRQNPSIRDCVVEATDHRGRRLRGTPLQIAAMTGEFNVTDDPEEKAKEGIVECIWDEYPEAEARRQIRAVFPENWQAITDARMQPLVTAVEEFMKAILAAKVTDYAALEIELKDAIEKFEKAFAPNPNQIITSGLVFDPKIIRIAMELFEAKLDQLGGYQSLKNDVFWIHGIGTLQANESGRDFRSSKKGIGNDEVGALSRDIHGPVDLLLGRSFFFGYFGDAVETVAAARGGVGLRTHHRTYVAQRHRRCKTYAATKQPGIEPMPGNIVFGVALRRVWQAAHPNKIR